MSILNVFSKAEAALKRSTAYTAKAPPAFDLKGVMASLTVLRLKSNDLSFIERSLRIKTSQLPAFFADAPVALDLSEMDPRQAEKLPFGVLLHVMKACKLVPVGVMNCPDSLRGAVTAAGLAIIQAGPMQVSTTTGDASVTGELPAFEVQPPPAPVNEVTQRTAEPPPPPRTSHRPPLVLRQPVRSGQEVYARRTDLIVMAPVNPGAQIYADGHIHVYAPLRGRAMAGAQGLAEARIYCQKLEAELVAIAGAYVMADEIPPDRRGRSAQIFLDNGECRISPL